MTTIEISRNESGIKRVFAYGHSGYAEAGEDIICAGISSIIQTAILGVFQILKVDILKSRNEEDGTLEIEVPDNVDASKDKDIQIILETMYCGLNDLCQSYPNNINIKEI